MRDENPSGDALLLIQLNMSLLGIEYMFCSELDPVEDVKLKR